MLKILPNTQAAIKKIISDLKNLVNLFTVGSNAIYILYLIYASFIAHTGILAVNIALMVIIVAYTAFYIAIWKNNKLAEKQTVRATKHAYSISRLIIKTFTLGIAVYAIATATASVDGIAIILAVFSIMSWLFGISLELFKLAFEKYSDFLIEEFRKDIKPLLDAKDIAIKVKDRGSEMLETVTSVGKKFGEKMRGFFGGSAPNTEYDENTDENDFDRLLPESDTAGKT